MQEDQNEDMTSVDSEDVQETKELDVEMLDDDCFPARKQTPQEIFDDFKDLKIRIACEVFGVENPRVKDGTRLFPKVSPKRLEFLEFNRSFIDDLRIDYEYVDDDIVTSAAIYARYDTMLNKAKRLQKRADLFLKSLKGQLYMYHVENWNNPNISKPTGDMIDALVNSDPSFILMSELRDNVEEAVNTLGTAVKAMRLKHEAVIEIGRTRRGELRMVGSTYVAGSENETPGRTPRGKRE